MKDKSKNEPLAAQKMSPKKTRRRFMRNTAGGVFALTLADLIVPPVQKARAHQLEIRSKQRIGV